MLITIKTGIDPRHLNVSLELIADCREVGIQVIVQWLHYVRVIDGLGIPTELPFSIMIQIFTGNCYIRT